ncbi:MAG: methyltransferase [Elusimicrobia bacterium]|nr:methyltransferase [Elusimicrobiota bacterium]
METIKKILLKLNLYEFARTIVKISWKSRFLLRYPPYDQNIQSKIIASFDPVRYQTIALAVQTIKKENIPGNFAEVGVYRGETSKFIHALDPGRKLYLFDTFEGFPLADLEKEDTRFRDTNIERVKWELGNSDLLVFKKGYFPHTTQGLEKELFSFVLLDLDLFKSTLAGLIFFYPRIAHGGYIFINDYNNPESNWAVSKAVKEFMKEKEEKIIEIPDIWGSVIFRKL